MKTQSNYLNFEELPNGNLKITPTKEGRAFIKEEKPNRDGNSIWYDLLEQTRSNGSYGAVDASQTGDLTDSPIILSNIDIDDDGELVIENETKKWWFPNYAVVDEITELAMNRPVIFVNAEN